MLAALARHECYTILRHLAGLVCVLTAANCRSIAHPPTRSKSGRIPLRMLFRQLRSTYYNYQSHGR